MNDKPTFSFKFDRNRQIINVYLWDVHPNTFKSWKMGRWGCFDSRDNILGDLHFVKSRVREDLVVHELFHALTEWMWRTGITVTRKNEEKIAETLDEMVRKFYRQYKKL